MNIPFTVTEFYGVFSAYNTAVWPMQLPLIALGVLSIVFLIRQRSNSSMGISAILTALLPCAATLFAIGLLSFLVKPYPRSVFSVQVSWCFVGSQADLGLIVAGVLGLMLIVQSKNLTPANGKASSQ